MIKSVGLILLFLSSVATGVYIANKKRAELALHKSNFKMLTEIKNTLRFNQSNKSKIYANLRQNGYGDCLDNYKNNAILKGYLDSLGTRDLYSELEAVTQCIEEYSVLLNTVKKDTEEKCKLAIGAGVLIGTFLTVILI